MNLTYCSKSKYFPLNTFQFSMKLSHKIDVNIPSEMCRKRDKLDNMQSRADKICNKGNKRKSLTQYELVCIKYDVFNCPP